MSVRINNEEEEEEEEEEEDARNETNVISRGSFLDLKTRSRRAHFLPLQKKRKKKKKFRDEKNFISRVLGP